LILIARQQQKISGHRMCVMMVNKSNGELPGILQTVFRGGSVCLPDSASSLVGSAWLGFLLFAAFLSWPIPLDGCQQISAASARRNHKAAKATGPSVYQSVNLSIHLANKQIPFPFQRRTKIVLLLFA